MKKVEGNKFMSRSDRANGEETVVGSDFSGTNEYGSTSERPGVTIYYSAGRTIQLEQFTFARFSIEIGATVSPDNTEKAQEYLRELLQEYVAREESKIRGGSYKENKIDAPVNVWGRVVELNYGMTIPTRKYESSKVDVGLRQPLNDDDDIDVVMERLQQDVAAMIKEEVAKIKSGESDVGL